MVVTAKTESAVINGSSDPPRLYPTWTTTSSSFFISLFSDSDLSLARALHSARFEKFCRGRWKNTCVPTLGLHDNRTCGQYCTASRHWLSLYLSKGENIAWECRYSLADCIFIFVGFLNSPTSLFKIEYNILMIKTRSIIKIINTEK